MSTLIHNIVKTDRGDYTFHTREEAEAFFIAVALREKERRSPMAAPARPPAAKPARTAAKRRSRSGAS
jgi:hypothetical protein